MQVTATGYLPFLDSWVGSSSISYTIFTGSVPPLVLAFFSFFLPKIMRWLTHYMGAMTHARLDRAVVARYFAFLVISQLVVFTLFGICIGESSVFVLALPRIH
jgi:calcium permeable stress-gated cation channel